jgi:preprotein translocase subunit SecA
VRFLYLMQILDANGNEIMPPGSVVRREISPTQPPASVPQIAPPTREHEFIEPASALEPQPISKQAAVSQSPNGGGKTSMDNFEKEFLRKKQRELNAARMAGGGVAETVAPRRTGEQAGRNDPCPCGSGKKYKKCHGA